ncbi:hypothetical protein DFH06DRAFT_1123775 [Mycena polygramma]|nr:hypothetical protein DFH06DRAFT_1123775 [Mycena polygramma]
MIQAAIPTDCQGYGATLRRKCHLLRAHCPLTHLLSATISIIDTADLTRSEKKEEWGASEERVARRSRREGSGGREGAGEGRNKADTGGRREQDERRNGSAGYEERGGRGTREEGGRRKEEGTVRARVKIPGKVRKGEWMSSRESDARFGSRLKICVEDSRNKGGFKERRTLRVELIVPVDCPLIPISLFVSSVSSLPSRRHLRMRQPQPQRAQLTEYTNREVCKKGALTLLPRAHTQGNARQRQMARESHTPDVGRARGWRWWMNRNGERASAGDGKTEPAWYIPVPLPYEAQVAPNRASRSQPAATLAPPALPKTQAAVTTHDAAVVSWHEKGCEVGAPEQYADAHGAEAGSLRSHKERPAIRRRYGDTERGGGSARVTLATILAVWPNSTKTGSIAMYTDYLDMQQGSGFTANPKIPSF